MKHLMTLAALFVSSLAMAQDYPEYPFPYNPDGNADGYIGLSDLLDLLVVYGQEYPGSFYGDSTGAVLNLGQMPINRCVQEAKAAGRQWRILTYDDLWNNFNSIAEMGQSYRQTVNPSGDAWFDFFLRDRGGLRNEVLRFYPNSTALVTDQPGSNGPEELMTTPGVVSDTDFEISFHSRHCIIATEALPEIEYAIVDGVESIADSLSNGWKPLGGYSVAGQAIWRFAQ